MARYTETLRDQYLRAIPGALVSVTRSDGTTATLTDDSAQPLANPFPTDAYGIYAFNTDPGVYTISFTYGGRTVFREVVAVGTPDADLSTLLTLASDDGSLIKASATLTLKQWIAQLLTSAGAALMGWVQSGTGAVTRLVRDKLRERVSVLDFGAVGDGVTIDTAAINKAIAACAAGKTLYFPAGTYLVDNSELIASSHGQTSTRPLPVGVNVLMEGGAWVKRAPAAVGVIFFTCDGNNTLQVNVDGDEYPGSMTGTWPGGSATFGVYSGTAHRVRVINSYFKNIKSYGIHMRGGFGWVVSVCDFYRIGLSGVLFQDVAAVEHCVVSNCTFEDMGDTATAFSPYSTGLGIWHNLVIASTAKNTNYRAAGFAFDVEGGYTPGLYHHNNFVGLTVEHTQGGAVAQGAFTINLLSQDSKIIGCVAQGRTNGALTSDVGVSIPGTTNVRVSVKLTNFRGGAVFADGAAGARIDVDSRNCGDGSNPLYSSVVLAYLSGSTDAVVSGEIKCDPNYRYAGNGGASIFARRFNSNNVLGLKLQNVTIRGPLGYGVDVFGFSGGSSTGRIMAENVEVRGYTDAELGSPVAWVTATAYAPGTVVTNGGGYYVIREAHTSGTFATDVAALKLGQLFNNPFVINYASALSLQNCRAYEVRHGFDLTGCANIEAKSDTIENLTVTTTIAVGLNLTSTDKAWVEGWKFNGTFTSKITTTSATNLTIRPGNNGFVSSIDRAVSGTTDASGDLTVTHGMDLTPVTAVADATMTTFAQVQPQPASFGATTMKLRFFDAAGAAIAATAVTAHVRAAA